MSVPTRRRAAGTVEPSTILLWDALILVLTSAGLVTAGLHLANAVAARPQRLPGNLAQLVVGLAHRTVVWTPAATVFTAVLAGAALAAAVVTVALVVRAGRRRPRVDRVAVHLGRGRDLDALDQKTAAATAKRLGVTAGPGLPIGVTVAGGRRLYSSWEDTCIDIWGPRRGKTSARAIPVLLEAPGPALATSNKRDLVDATRDLRSTRGRGWVFDPQDVAGEEPRWWWNPLSYVVDDATARRLAAVLATAARPAGARVDAFFDPAAQSLLTGLLLAAALAGRPIIQVYRWIADPTNDEPTDLLRPGYPLIAAAVAGAAGAPDKQRAGIYGTAQELTAWLTASRTTRWITADSPDDRRPQFHPAAFVASADTLYSLSREGDGCAAPLITALTMAVTEAAETAAKRYPAGRLPVPLVCVLDEAANVCRWAQLPNLYSHYGSRGIILYTMLQSWRQGVEVWGADGMAKLWSAANIRVYGGGVADPDFLGALAQLTGEVELPAASTSTGRGGSSVSRSLQRQRILDVADLGALPAGRAVVFASGTQPTLVRTLPWMASPHAAAIQASIAAHDPATDRTRTAAATPPAATTTPAPSRPDSPDNPGVRT